MRSNNLTPEIAAALQKLEDICDELSALAVKNSITITVDLPKIPETLYIIGNQELFDDSLSHEDCEDIISIASKWAVQEYELNPGDWITSSYTC